MVESWKYNPPAFLFVFRVWEELAKSGALYLEEKGKDKRAHTPKRTFNLARNAALDLSRFA